MYRISKNTRKHSTTPIVRLDDNGKEEIVLVICNQPKKEGDVFAENVVKMLNNQVNISKERLDELELIEAKYKALLTRLDHFFNKV